jgi:hypothetical protein
MSFTQTFSGQGEALVVREKCNSNKSFTSSYTTEFSNDEYLLILNYQNSFIGKRLLSTVYNGNEVVTVTKNRRNRNFEYFKYLKYIILYNLLFIKRA